MKTFLASSMATMLKSSFGFEKLVWVFPNPQFVEHAIPGFPNFESYTLLLQRACVPELGVKPFKRATLGPGAVSVT